MKGQRREIVIRNMTCSGMVMRSTRNVRERNILSWSFLFFLSLSSPRVHRLSRQVFS